MQPQECCVCYDNKEKKCSKKVTCLWIILGILLALFPLAIGLLIGTALASTILSVLSAIIVLAIILGLLLILTIILLLCNRKKEKNVVNVVNILEGGNLLPYID